MCVCVCVGTFAVVQLMIGNSIDKVISQEPGLQSCVEQSSENTSKEHACSMAVCIYSAL